MTESAVERPLILEPRVLGAAFQARHIAVSMAKAVCVGVDEDVASATTRLDAGRFDQAPVVDGDRPIGFVLTPRIRGQTETSVRELMEPVGQGNVVSADAPVGSLLDWIVDPGFLFVVDGVSITGFITVSDFNKQPVRGYLYLQLAALETNLAELVQGAFNGDEDSMLAPLNADGRREVRRRREADRAVRLDTDLVAYLVFSQLLKIARADARLARTLGPQFGTDAGDLDLQLSDLRNRIMHPVRGLVNDKGQLTALRDIENSIDRMSRTVAAALQTQ